MLKLMNRETNLDDVLQIGEVFVNVSKGEQAKAGDLKKAFGKIDEADIIKEVPSSPNLLILYITQYYHSLFSLFLQTEKNKTKQTNLPQILTKGDLQVGEKEREHELSALRKDITHRVTESVVDPSTQQRYSLAIIEKALAEVGFSVDPARNAKSQVLAAIKLLQQNAALPIQRARMRVRVTLPVEVLEGGEAEGEKGKGKGTGLEEKIRSGAEVVDSCETREDEWEAVSLQ